MIPEIGSESRAKASALFTGQKMTFEEFLSTGEEVRAEWVDGEVVLMSEVNWDHQKILGFLFALLKHGAENGDAGEVTGEPFIMKTGPDLPGRSPDILFVAKENLGRLRRNYLEGPADLVVEIVSPDSGARDRRDKLLEYEKGKVREYWLIDPQRKQAEFYRLEDNVFHLLKPDQEGKVRSKVLDVVWIKPKWLWQEKPPQLMQVLKEWGIV